MVYRYARWRTGSQQRAEEVVSDVFVEAWRSRDAYDPERGSVESWLLGIARNVLRRDERAEAREAERRGAAELDDLASPGPGPEEEALRRRRVERILEAVWDLPSADRDLVALAYGADLPRRRIARVLDLSPEAVRVRLHRVLARLRERLGEGDGDG
jgi:RNA polymerase sigma-70 factor (ECF subfamily)